MAFEFNVADKGIVLANPHRGFSECYPENTMHAFQGTLDAGVHTLELDTVMVKDEEFVIIHDHIIDRVSTGIGVVEDMTFEQLRQYDFGIKFSPEFINTPIPNLRDVLIWAVKNNVGLVLELKQRRNHDRCAQKLADLLLDTNAVDNVVLLGFDHVLINKVKQHIPSLRLQVVTLARYVDNVSAVLRSNASSVCCEYYYVHRDDLVAYKNAGLSTRLYLHESKDIPTIEMYHKKLGYDVEQEIIGWMRDGLIDMLSHDDVEYLKKLIIKAGKIPY